METTTEPKNDGISMDSMAIKLGKRLFAVWVILAFVAGVLLVFVWPPGLSPATLGMP